MAKNFEAWQVNESDFPKEGTTEEKLRFLLRYAILAPSGPNTQPWKFAINSNTVSIFADLNRSLPLVDPSNRTLFMSVGCALANFRVAGEHFGFICDVEYYPQGQGSELVANVKFMPHKKLDKENLFHQITRRHTIKNRYENREIDASILEDLRTGMGDPGVYLHYFTDERSKSKIAGIVARAHRLQLARKEFRRNLGEWLRNNWTTEPDGMPLYTFGVPDAVALGFPAAFKEFDLSDAVIYRDSGLIHGCSVLGILTTDGDDRLSWARCGEALEKFLLGATKFDIRASFFSQPISLMELREEIDGMVKRGHSQLLFSLGYADPIKPTPRRALADVIL